MLVSSRFIVLRRRSRSESLQCGMQCVPRELRSGSLHVQRPGIRDRSHFVIESANRTKRWEPLSPDLASWCTILFNDIYI